MKYDLEGFQHPRYPHCFSALHVQFTDGSEDTCGPSLEIDSAFSVDLYTFVTQWGFANNGLGGMVKPSSNIVTPLIASQTNLLKKQFFTFSNTCPMVSQPTCSWVEI